MPKPWSCKFEVNGTWYEMDNDLYQTAKQALDKDWTNAKIVAKLKELKYRFTTDPKNGFITID
jgi:hypothetical protein